MLNRPCFKSCYTVKTIEPDQVFLISEREQVCLSDRFLYLVASLINGDRTSDEIIDKIQWKVLQQQESTLDQATLFQSVLDVSIKAQAALFQMEQQGSVLKQKSSPNKP